MRKKYWAPILNMLAMLLLVFSRVESESFGWIGIAASTIFLLSLGHLIYLIKKTK